LDKLPYVRPRSQGLARIRINRRTHPGYIRRSPATLALMAAAIRPFSQAGSSWLVSCPVRLSAINRVTPKLILSKASEPQPEPEPEQDHFAQFAKIDEGFWAWHFTLRDSRGEELASISRAFRGLGREIFTDTGKPPTSLQNNKWQYNLGQDNTR